ncbi:nicotinate-nucleotide--dimethylbenzimidazole phosphoribosyltransferase [Oceanisphaera arctica]|uniref:Nicotinate-nucleotide--dimethylbenzimidazole phosphoribosyltransferase n=1 Tax=Oceanisphaera arctica TaxID=641510 RepID=A0A2P5TN23_9GAMM|nr:nicotinate-nucleotide--dimethylbenzimidazole phosphoribosyltransferase [Oceanisphaera arctica]PPL16918.1 nicotinate-nucleotide--dimethylbenzimidazole phosphoribosyltransferase [Oceanisphaera arctica]GHA19237.1 nicotinate-nucleotide--dimethylbenzimidazole phosphoribosyltransferase [Oceanisphaera arctica]
MSQPLPLPTIPELANSELTRQLLQVIDQKTKPLGALGRLETLALQLGLIQGRTNPVIQQPQIRVFAADHGLTRHGTSAYPSAVTAQMVHNFLLGGAAINVFARQHKIGLQVVDAGVDAEFDYHPALLDCKVRRGSRDAMTEAAMTEAECREALEQGMALVEHLPGNLLIVGEMGIGNTSAASLLLSRLGDLPLADCVGRGTGLDDEGLRHKQQILTQVLRHHQEAITPLAALRALGGLEIAMMVGALIQAASQRRILLMDGFIAGVALLVAEQLAPGVRQYAVFAHHSAEPGHEHLLRLLDAEPLLNMKMRLGEGSGAVLAYPLLQSACAFLNEMASFTDAGISGPADDTAE